MNDIIPDAKYEVGQFFFQKKKRKLFKILAVQWQGVIRQPTKSKVKEGEQTINDWLYDIQYVNTEAKPVHGRYYEARLSNECTLVEDQTFPKSIYE